MAALTSLLAGNASAAGAPSLASTPTLAIGMPGPVELTIILVIMLLLFGRRLPEVMRSMGRGVVEFKKGVKGIEDEIDVGPPSASSSAGSAASPGVEKTAGAPSSSSEKSE